MRLLIVLVLLTSVAQAMVRGYETHWWPVEGESLPPVPIIGISGQSWHLNAVKSLTDIWLVSNAHRVPLELMAHNKGAGIEQFVWAPQEPLQVGRRYVLEYAIGAQRVQPTWARGFGESQPRMSWLVESKPSTPRWLWPPEPVGGGGQSCMSCGCSVSQLVRIETQSSQTIEVSVNDHTWIQHVPRKSTVVDIGYGVMGGPNPLRINEFNTIEFAILDGWARYPASKTVTTFIPPQRPWPLPVKGELSGIYESSWTLMALFSVLGLWHLRRGGARSKSDSVA